MQSFGSYLKLEREKKDIRLEEIASITKIHLSSLEMMEKDRWSELPPEPFIRGFITAYAKYVGLNPKETLEIFRKFNSPVVEEAFTSGGGNSEVDAETPVKIEIPEPPKPVRNADELSSNEATPLIRKTHLAVGVGILVLGVLILLAWIGNKESGPSLQLPITESLHSSTESPLPSPLDAVLIATPPPSISPLPSSEPTVGTQLNHLVPPPSSLPTLVASNTPVPTVAAVPSPVPTSKAAPLPSAAAIAANPSQTGHELVVIGKYRSWIKVVIDDAPPIEYFLGESEKATYKATQKIKIVLGNSAGAEIFHNGELSPGVKFSGTIRSYIFPPNARFPQDKVKRAAPADTEFSVPVKPEAPGQDE